jgi:hypothetical protein
VSIVSVSVVRTIIASQQIQIYRHNTLLHLLTTSVGSYNTHSGSHVETKVETSEEPRGVGPIAEVHISDIQDRGGHHGHFREGKGHLVFTRTLNELHFRLSTLQTPTGGSCGFQLLRSST